jgi:hypothetical protein
MSRRDEWRKVLDAETARWAGKTCDQLLDELHELQNYVVEVDSKKYQVEVEIFENTDESILVGLGIDDGDFFSSIHPESRAFIKRKS